ncbi:MAG: hypothetical protein ACPG5B_01795 [Chitinophagales bacterium]
MINKFLRIFSDPFFWVLASILVSIVYGIYRIYVLGTYRMGVSEVELALEKKLEQKGWEALSFEDQNDTGIFEKTKGDATADEVTYHLVKAQKKTGENADFWAKVVYRKGELQAISWQPKL